MIWLIGALGLAVVYISLLTNWVEKERRDNSRLRARSEARARRLGSRREMAARVGDLSEGTLSPAHAQDIADWILDEYHHEHCALICGYPWCTCDGTPATLREGSR